MEEKTGHTDRETFLVAKEGHSHGQRHQQAGHRGQEPDPRLFEEAIFILREGALTEGASPEQVLREATQAARSYIVRSRAPGKWFQAIPAPAYAAAGALAATAVWSLALFC